MEARVAVTGKTGLDNDGGGHSCEECNLFWRQFSALARKNLLLKRRAPLQLLFELGLPLLFIYILVQTKEDFEITTHSSGMPVDDTPVPTYETLQTYAVYPNVLCYDDNLFMRCGCPGDEHSYDDDFQSSWNAVDFLVDDPINVTGPAMWATGHSASALHDTCWAANVESYSNHSAVDRCTTAKFTTMICLEGLDYSDDSYGSDDDPAEGLDAICGPGTSALDLSATDYLEIITDTLALIEEDEVAYGTTIQEDEVDTVCQSLRLAVMPADDNNGGDQATDFLEFVTTAYPETADRWEIFDTEKDFIEHISDDNYSQAIGQDYMMPVFSTAIVFSSGGPDWEYTIRANASKYKSSTDNVPTTKKKIDSSCRDPMHCTAWTTVYHQSAVLSLQQLVDNWIVNQTVVDGSTVIPKPEVRLSEFPNDSYKTSAFWEQVSFVFALLMTIAVMLPVANVIHALVKEKELRIKEGLKIMGLTSLAHTSSWIFHFTCLFLVTSTLLTILSQNLFEHSDLGLIFLYFFLFFMATTAFCFFISAFFSRAKTAATLGSLIYFVALFPYFAVNGDSSTSTQRRAACLLPTTCLALGTVAFQDYEDLGLGVTSETAGTSERGFSFNGVLGMFVVDIIFYSCLAWYAGHVLPSEWGTAQKPWFVFTKSFWRPALANRDSMAQSKQLLAVDESENRESVEPVSEQLRAQVQEGDCVVIRDLTKVYKNSTGGVKVAVDKLDLTMYSGQITALLGHNGAGKTTTIAMLTGMTPVTSGHAFVAGKDAKCDMVNIRRSLGVCPQHDILYPDLTVREHLRLYAVLKGVPRSLLRDVIKKTLLDVGLTEKENERTKTLSGGQKRKLSVGIALLGGSRVVFLDEPTSGMDPHSRRFTWELIRKNREGRVIVLTTHFMDEADLLGDRVAIMADGALKCCGSSLFLKNHYGVGYNLTIVRAIGGASAGEADVLYPTTSINPKNNGTATVASAEGAQEENEVEKSDGAKYPQVHLNMGGSGGGGSAGSGLRTIKQLVHSHVRSAALLSNVGAELSFQLPNDASSTFKAMLSEIDARQDELGINSYGMSVTTLDEVFLRVAEGTADFASRKQLLDANGNSGEQVMTQSMQRDENLSSSMISSLIKGEPKKAAVGGNKGHGHGKHSVNISAPTASGTVAADARAKSGLARYDSPFSLFFVHMVALLKKRYLTFRRDKKIFAFVVLMPALFVFAGIMIVRIDNQSDQPSLRLTPEQYNKGGAPFPYAEQCTNTVSGGTCDPAELMVHLTVPESATPMSLDIDEASVAPEDGVGLLNEALLASTHTYTERVYGALSFREADTTTGTFDYTIHSNYSALHAVPTYLNQMNTAILRLLSGDVEASITTTMHPMPRTTREKRVDVFDNAFEGVLVSFFIMIAFTFVPAGWIGFIVRERENKCKYQQVVSGVGLNAYWISSLLWDFFSALIPAGFTLLVLYLRDVSALLENGAAWALVCVFLFYALSMPSYTYLWSFLFKSHSVAQNTFLAMNFVIGLLSPLIIFVMSFGDGPVGKVGKGLGWTLRCCPQFSLGESVIFLGFASIGDELGEDWGPFDMDFTGKGIIYMACCSVGYLIILLALERVSAGSSAVSGLCAQARVAAYTRSMTPAQWGDEDQIDEDVATEVRRVASGAADTDVVKIEDLVKIYPSSRGVKVAVKSTFLGIPRGECFGLLGVNGAGKSSTLSILSGEIPPTRGAAFLGGYDVCKDPEAIHRLVGYCPQFDALFETLTGREHLKLYGAIKGIRSDNLDAAVKEKIDEMGLGQYADRLAGGYSGGNKRKLSVAVAMIGNPEIVFLDEPSTGMDPMARRMMWNYVKRTVTENKECAMILTTHSMDECEALCQRIGIMVGGRMRCLGSSQHLKTRFGKGFMLEARVAAISADEINVTMSTIAPVTDGQVNLPAALLGPALDAVQMPELAPQIVADGFGASIYHALLHHGAVSTREFSRWLCLERKCKKVVQFMGSNFHGVVLREKQNAKMRFEFPQQQAMTLADIFGVVEENCVELCIGEYALSQTSLEQIFNSFAAQQEENQGRAAGMM